MTMCELNLASIVPCTESEGPGRRTALWVQGCLRRCAGCCNRHMWPFEPRQIVGWQALADLIASYADRFRTEGITLLGGEPFLQAAGLSRVAGACRDMGLSVMVFTGYTVEELERLALPHAWHLLTVTDLLVDGPYLEGLPESRRNWVGSTNQRFLYLTERYDASIETDPASAPSVEIRVSANGELRINGAAGLVGFAKGDEEA